MSHLKKVFIFLCNSFFFFAFTSLTYAGSGTLRVTIEEPGGVPSYADSVVISYSGSAGAPRHCDDDPDYIGGHCFRYVYQPSTKKGIKIVNFSNIEPGQYYITANRAEYTSGSNAFPIGNPNTDYDGTVTIQNKIAPTGGFASPTIDDPGTVTRGSSIAITASGFNDGSWTNNRFALVVVDQTGNRFDCQEMTRVSPSVGSANVGTPSDIAHATVTFQLFRTISKTGSIPACDDLSGQSSIHSVTANLTAVTGGSTPLPSQVVATSPVGNPSKAPPPIFCSKGRWDHDNSDATDPVPAPSRDKIQICDEVDTAIGTFSTNPTQAVGSIFAVILGLAGGIALLLIIYAGYRLMTSQGNPEKTHEAQEILSSAVIGLVFIIFSLVVLRVIGVDILGIPGLGSRIPK